MEDLPYDLVQIGMILLIAIVLLAIPIAITRWILRINEIVDLLTEIRDSLKERSS